MKILFIIILLSFSSFSYSQDLSTMDYSVSDYIKYVNKDKKIFEEMNPSIKKYLQKYNIKPYKDLKVLNLMKDNYLLDIIINKKSPIDVTYTLIINYKKQVQIVRFVSIFFLEKELFLEKTNDEKISDLTLWLELSLDERMLSLVSKEMGVIKHYPLGLGGLNSSNKSLTPHLTNAYLVPEFFISNREKPFYFKGEPFLRIMTLAEDSYSHSPYGFHVAQNEDYYTGSVDRGYVSHGCIRLRKKEIRELYIMLKDYKKSIHINFTKEAKKGYFHPLPKNDKYYYQITEGLDEHGLKNMEKKKFPKKHINKN